MTDNFILKAAKRLKTFTLDDIVMLCNIDTKLALKTLMESKNISILGNNNFKYIELLKTEDKFKIINKNINYKNSDITVIEACNIFLGNTQKLKYETFRTYKSYINAHIIPYFGKSKLKNISVCDVDSFRKNMQNLLISERRIKNILALLNQLIKYFQTEGYIERTCIFEVKRLEKIPKREIQILSEEQLAQLFKITKNKYPYLLPIIQKVITLKHPLNTILTGDERQINSLKRKIRKDFCKIKKKMNLENYMFGDLRSIDNEKLVSQLLCE